MQPLETIKASPMLPDNVRMLGAWDLHTQMEGVYWIDVMQRLAENMGSSFAEHEFIFHSLTTKKTPQVDGLASDKRIMIILSDNSGKHFSEHFAGFKAVFKVHLFEAYGNVHPVPLGYTKMHLSECDIPADQRAKNVFFSGNLNAPRMDMYRSLLLPGLPPKKNIANPKLRKLMSHFVYKARLPRDFDKTFPDSYIRFTSGFAKGLGGEEYTSMLASSKIAISPRGFLRPECFRHFEAMRSGCVVISDPLPKTWYFDGSPIVELARWSDLRRTVDSLIKDTQRMQEVQKSTLDWWNEKCSPQAAASYMAGVIM